MISQSNSRFNCGLSFSFCRVFSVFIVIIASVKIFLAKLQFFFKYAKQFAFFLYICIVIDQNKHYRIVYCTPALYMAGGVERVLTLKANYFAEHFGYDITIILTEGKGKPFFYPLSDKVKVINLDVGFEELWKCSFINKIIVYLKKQHRFKKLLSKELMRIRPDITISLLRREINFINDVCDGSKKVGELHINRANYRNFDNESSNLIKIVFAKLWMHNLVGKLQHLDRLVVLTEIDKNTWTELSNVTAIPNPLSFEPVAYSEQIEKRVIVIGRYCHEKGYDYLLKAWSEVQNQCVDWRLEVFGDGDRRAYDQMLDELSIDRSRCMLNGRTSDVQSEYARSSLAVCTSRFEGFGLVIVEAMACGVPVVSFDCPWGPRSIITNGEDGILVENGNVKKLADEIIKLINEADVRVMMAKKARQNVMRFNMEQVALRWKQLFDSLWG